MLARDAAQGPQGVLEALGQRGEALATEDDGGVLPAAVGEREVVEPVREGRTRDRHAEGARVGEVRQRHAAGLRGLPEDPVTRGAVQRAPVAHPPFQRPPDPVVGERLGVRHLQMAQERDRLHGGVALEDRQHHRLPHRGEGVGDGAAALGTPLRGKTGVGLEAASGAFAEAGAGRGKALEVTGAVVHVQSRLLVGDGFARHVGTSVWRQRSRSYRPAAASTPTPSPLRNDRAGGVSLRAGYAHPAADAAGQLGCRHRSGWLSPNTPARVNRSGGTITIRSLKKRRDASGRSRVVHRSVPVPPDYLDTLDTTAATAVAAFWIGVNSARATSPRSSPHQPS